MAGNDRIGEQIVGAGCGLIVLLGILVGIVGAFGLLWRVCAWAVGL